jgi:hypothetical protein
LSFTLVALLSRSSFALTRVEGEYQIQLDIRKQDRLFPWDYDYNTDDSFGLVQFRVFSQPRPDVEAFLKFEEDWNGANNGGLRPEFQFREAHVRYRFLREGRGFDTYVFSRQDRFWVENHLIEVVRPGVVKDSDNAQGARFDIFGYAGANLTYIYSDFSSQSNPGLAEPFRPVGTDDAHVIRARREFLSHSLRTGLTYNRKVESQGRENSHVEVFAGDLRYARGSTDFLLEYAESHERNTFREPIVRPDSTVYVPDDGQFEAPTFGELLEPYKWFPSDAIIRAEIRAITFGSPKLGYYNVAPEYWFAGADFNNPLGDPLRDERGFFLNTWYLVPERAITFTVNYGQWKKQVFEQKNLNELFVEVYTEYVNGFRSKIFHRRRRTRDFSNPREVKLTRNYDLFVEVQVESRLAWLRIQGKIKDMNEASEKELASLETSVNLTSTLKVYNRFTFSNDPAALRESFFAELQFRPRPNMEMFLSYGPWWIGDRDNPVEDGDVEGGAKNKDIIKFTLKGFF